MIREIYAENGILGGTILLLVFLILFVLVLPFLPFYVLNETSKNLFKGDKNYEET